MNIVLAFNDKNNKWPYLHYISELSDNMHKVNVVQIEKDDCFNNGKKIISICEKNNIDLFVTGYNDRYVSVELVNEIKRRNIKTLLICSDNLVIPYEHKKVCKYYDLVWITSSETQYLFERWGAKTIFMPYAANPKNYYHIEYDYLIPRVCFVGTPYGSRINMINNLTRNGIGVDVYANKPSFVGVKNIDFDIIKILLCRFRFKIGIKIMYSTIINRFKHEELEYNQNLKIITKYTDLEEMRQIYSKYKLSLASSSALNSWVIRKPIDIVNLRSFEIPSCGGVQFVQKTKELSHYFKNNEDIVFYKNKKDMVKVAKEFLNKEDDDIKKVMIASRQKIIREHTWMHRFKNCFILLGLCEEEGF